MTPIKARVKDRRIAVEVPKDWPDGVEVRIELVSDAPQVGMREEDWPTTPEGIAALVKRMSEPLELSESPLRVGIDESEWRDDSEALADWEVWIKQIKPPDLTPEEKAVITRFDEQMRTFNLEAVRRQLNLPSSTTCRD